MQYRIVSVGAACMLALAGCKSDGNDAPADGGTSTDGSADGSHVTPTRDGGGDAAPAGDNDNSFATATAVDLSNTNGGEALDGVINPAGDHDYYSFQATAGDWIVIDTEGNPDEEQNKVDTVITLFDSAMTKIAENDDSVPRTSPDSEILFHIPTTGTYYVDVQEFSTWKTDDDIEPEGSPTYEYTLTVAKIKATNAGISAENETGNDAAHATALSVNMNTSLILGTFASNTDIDVYSFTAAAGQSVEVQFMPSGDTGYGSTGEPGSVWITDMTGAVVYGKVELSSTLDSIQPPLAAGSFLLWIQHSGDTAGANDFYAAKVFFGTDNPAEAADTTNGVLATAEALTLAADPDDGSHSGFILGTLGTADVDYYSFTVAAGEQINAVCVGARSGSGVTGLTIDIRSATDVSLGTKVEALGEDGVAFVQNIEATAGTYYLRVTKTGQASDNDSNWYRCGVHLAQPAEE